MENLLAREIEKVLCADILWEYSPANIKIEHIKDYNDNEYTFTLGFDFWEKEVELFMLYNSEDNVFKIQPFEEGEYINFGELEFWKSFSIFLS